MRGFSDLVQIYEAEICGTQSRGCGQDTMRKIVLMIDGVQIRKPLDDGEELDTVRDSIQYLLTPMVKIRNLRRIVK